MSNTLRLGMLKADVFVLSVMVEEGFIALFLISNDPNDSGDHEDNTDDTEEDPQPSQATSLWTRVWTRIWTRGWWDRAEWIVSGGGVSSVVVKCLNDQEESFGFRVGWDRSVCKVHPVEALSDTGFNDTVVNIWDESGGLIDSFLVKRADVKEVRARDLTSGNRLKDWVFTIADIET